MSKSKLLGKRDFGKTSMADSKENDVDEQISASDMYTVV